MNLPNGTLKLSRATYCAIADGVITRWEDPAITRDNNNIPVRTGPLTFVRRSDASGETLYLSNHLQTVCTGRFNFPAPYKAAPYPADLLWKRGAGATSEARGQTDTLADTVDWPDSFLAVQGGDDVVVRTIRNQQGTLGYVGAAYTNLSIDRRSGLPAARLQNQSNLTAIALNQALPQYYAASAQATGSALSNSVLDTPFVDAPFVREVALNSYSNPTGSSDYPLVSVIYGLFYEHYNQQLEVDQCGCFGLWALQNPYPDPVFNFGSNPNPNPIAQNRTYGTLSGPLKTEVLAILAEIKLSSQFALRPVPRPPIQLASTSLQPYPLLGQSSKCRDLR